MKEYKDGIYQGEFNSQFKHGLGIYLWDVGYAYYGEWKQDLIDGQGILFLGGQIIIQGTFRKGVPQGYLVIKVGNRVFYSQFDKGEAIFIQEGEKKIIIQSSSAQITNDCNIEADRILQSISHLSNAELQIQLFNHCIYYGSVGKANIPNGLGIEISNMHYMCGQFIDGKLNGVGRFDQMDQIYQGQFIQNLYHGHGLTINKEKQWIKGKYQNGQLIEIRGQGQTDLYEIPSELVCKLLLYLLVPYSKKANLQQYTVPPISQQIILGYLRLFEVMQFVRLRVNTLTDMKQIRKYSSVNNNNTISKSVEEIKKLQSQFNNRNIEQQNQLYEIILNQHDDNETLRKTDQSRMKTQPTEDCIDNKISFGLLDLRDSRHTAVFSTDDQQQQIKRSLSQNEVQTNTQDRMLTLKNILEAQKSKYNTEQKFKKNVFTNTTTNKQILSQKKNLKCLSEVVQKELQRSPSDERRSTIKPVYEDQQQQQQDQSSQKTLPTRCTSDYSSAFNEHKNKIHTLLNKFNSIKIQQVKSTKNNDAPLTNIQNISLVSHNQLQNSIEKKQSKKLDETCSGCMHDEQNTKYIQEIRQELAEQKQMLTQLFQSLQQPQKIIKRIPNTPSRNIPKSILVSKGTYPAFAFVKQMSPVRM